MPDNPATPTPSTPPPQQPSGSFARDFLLVFISVAVTATVIYFGSELLLENIYIIAAIFLTVIIIFGGLAIAVAMARSWIQRKVLNVANASLSEMTKPLESALDAVLRRDADEAKVHGWHFLRLLIDRYSWMMTRNWIIQSILSLLLAFATLTGSALLIAQNKLISQQNAIAEASRRSSLVFELTSILDKIDAEIRQVITAVKEPERPDYKTESAAETKKHLILRHTPRWSLTDDRTGEDFAVSKHGCIKLSDHLESRIAAISHTFVPYRRLEDSGKLGPIISPERGLLLRALLTSDIDMQYMTVGLLDLSYADLRNSNLTATDLSGLHFDNAYFDGSDLEDTNFERAMLRNASFRNCKFAKNNFKQALLPKASAFEGTRWSSHSNLPELDDALVDSPDWFEELTVPERMRNELCKYYKISQLKPSSYGSGWSKGVGAARYDRPPEYYGYTHIIESTGYVPPYDPRLALPPPKDPLPPPVQPPPFERHPPPDHLPPSHPPPFERHPPPESEFNPRPSSPPRTPPKSLPMT
jgi:hypothetical protein